MAAYELEFFGGSHNRYRTTYSAKTVALPEVLHMPDLLSPDEDPEPYDRAGVWSTRRGDGSVVLYAWFIARESDRPKQDLTESG